MWLTCNNQKLITALFTSDYSEKIYGFPENRYWRILVKIPGKYSRTLLTIFVTQQVMAQQTNQSMRMKAILV